MLKIFCCVDNFQVCLMEAAKLAGFCNYKTLKLHVKFERQKND